MRRITLFISAVLLVFIYSFLNAAETPSLPKASCSITCYEKTPSCYVSKDSTGCLVISDKPICDAKGSCHCSLKSCKLKTVYDTEHGKTKTETVTNPAE